MAVIVEPWSNTDAEYAAVARIWAGSGAISPQGPTDLRDRTEALRSSGFAAEYRLGSIGEGPVGFVGFSHLPTAADRDVVTVRLMVLPWARRRGVGTVLHQAMMTEAGSLGVSTALAYVDEREVGGVAFAAAARYRCAGRYIESLIDPSRVDTRMLDARAAEAAHGSVHVASVAELRSTDPGWFAKLHRLYVTVSADTPFPIPEAPVSPDVLRRRIVESEAGELDAIFIARHGDDWVGMTELRRDGIRAGAWVQDLTGVVRSHRRRGIASALKARSLLDAQRRSATRLRTWNHEDNVGIRTINREFGFTESHTVSVMLRSISGDSGVAEAMQRRAI